MNRDLAFIFMERITELKSLLWAEERCPYKNRHQIRSLKEMLNLNMMLYSWAAQEAVLNDYETVVQ